MNMKRYAVGLVRGGRNLLLVALLSAGQATEPAADSGTSIVDLIRGQSASASFESFDPTGCIVIDVEVDRAFSFQRQPGTGTFTLNQTGLSMEIFDLCNVNVIIGADGVSTSQSLQISKDATSATLTAVVMMIDQFGLNFTANVSLTFTATGPLQRNRSTNVSTASGMTVVTVVKGQGVDAQAVGTISITADAAHPAIANIVPMPSFDGTVQNATLGSITITRPK